MKTVSILEYDHDEHQFYPSFVIKDDYQDHDDNECAFDELVIQPSEEWMDDYLEWNRFGRLPDDPAGVFLDEVDDHASSAIPVFSSLRDLQTFNERGYDLTERLAQELATSSNCGCPIRVAPYRPLYSNMLVGPVAAWWHVKDCNYGLVVPVQRLPVSNQLKARLQAFRCHKGIEFWQNNNLDETETMMRQLQQERNDLQLDVVRELRQVSPAVGIDNAKNKEKSHRDCVSRTDSMASLGTLMEQACSLVAPSHIEKGKRCPTPQRVAERTMHGDVQSSLQARPFANPIPRTSQLSHLAIQQIACRSNTAPAIHGF
jgi:hypothetical protein